MSHLLYIQGRKGMRAMLKMYERIKELRKQNNWTQEELAQKVGYTDRSTIAKIESGKIDIPQSKIIEFAEVFGVNAGDLLGYGDDVYVTTLQNKQEEEKAKELYEIYKNATPEIQSAVELLLRSSQLPSESPLKNINTVE